LLATLLLLPGISTSVCWQAIMSGFPGYTGWLSWLVWLALLVGYAGKLLGVLDMLAGYVAYSGWIC
jgi:hypothetical protein